MWSITTQPPPSRFPRSVTGWRTPITIWAGSIRGYNADLIDVLNFAKTTPQDFLFSSTQGADPSDFTITEKVSAGYVMNTIDISTRVRLIVGLRAEVTADDIRNLAFGTYPCATGSCTSVRPNTFNGSYYNLLPVLLYAIQ